MKYPNAINPKVFTCGTRVVMYYPLKNGDVWRVLCATCGAGGTVKHRTLDAATRACVRDSGKTCGRCGAS